MNQEQQKSEAQKDIDIGNNLVSTIEKSEIQVRPQS